MTRFAGLIVVAFALSRIVAAAELPVPPTFPELAAVKQRYDKPMAEVGAETEERLKRLKTEYMSALDDLKRAMTAQGNLDGVLAVKTEMERVFNGKETTDDDKKAMSSVMQTKRRQYEASLDRLLKEQDQKQAGVLKLYVRDLESLQTRLTQQGNVDAAVAVKAEKERAKSLAGQADGSSTGGSPATGPGVAEVRGKFVLHYTFDIKEDRAVTDQSPNHNNGTVHGATFEAAGKLGGAYRFSGKDSYIEVPNNAGLNPKKALTLAAWIKVKSRDPTPTAVISKGSFGTGKVSYALLVHDGPLGFILNRDGTDKGQTWVIGSDIPLNEWTHVACTYDGATMRIYVNGKPSSWNPHPGGINATPDPVLIGKIDRTGSPVRSGYFNGAIDDVRIYNSALSEKEIHALSTAGGPAK